uniref:Uncharacterized protein n=1 Tax=Erinnyis ello granulovirus TaxID=307444 RepID=A0A288WIK5_9BBAC|nr:hypothetical protein EREL_033 [Erinnyis ello granulovirus]
MESSGGLITFFKFTSTDPNYINYVLSKLHVIMAKYDQNVCSAVCYDDEQTTRTVGLFNDRVSMSQKHGFITHYSQDVYTYAAFIKAMRWMHKCEGEVYHAYFNQ